MNNPIDEALENDGNEDDFEDEQNNEELEEAEEVKAPVKKAAPKKKAPAKKAVVTTKKVPTKVVAKAPAKAAAKTPAKKVPAAKVKAPRIQAEVQNEVARPSKDTTSGKVWAFADAAHKTKTGAVRKNILEKAAALGINQSTAATQYARWRQFNGITGV